MVAAAALSNILDSIVSFPFARDITGVTRYGPVHPARCSAGSWA